MFVDDAPAVSPLPGPPLLDRLLYEMPWPSAIALVVVGIIVFTALNRSGRARLGGGILVGTIVLASGNVLLATFVTTPRETVTARSRELVHAVATVNSSAILAIVHPDGQLKEPVRGTRLDREQILHRVREAIPPLGINSARVVESQAAIDGANVARTQVRVAVDSGTVPPYSWWRLHWRLEAGD